MLRNTHFFSGCSTGNSKKSLVASIHFEKQIHPNSANLLELRHLHGHISNDAEPLMAKVTFGNLSECLLDKCCLNSSAIVWGAC